MTHYTTRLAQLTMAIHDAYLHHTSTVQVTYNLEDDVIAFITTRPQPRHPIPTYARATFWKFCVFRLTSMVVLTGKTT
jgi:hypothetical protein